MVNRSILVFAVTVLIVTAAFIPISVLLTHDSSQRSSTATTTTNTFVPTMANETFQFVGATIMDLGRADAAAVNATYTNNLSQPLSAMVIGVAYPAQAQYGPGASGKLLGPGCCPIVKSYSTIGSISASAKVSAGSREEVSTSLVFSALNATGIYWVKLSAVSLNGTTTLSPISYVLLETAGAVEAVSYGGTGACGGQEDVGPIFMDSYNGEVYVANSGTDAISVLNGSTGGLVATISLPSWGGQLSFSNDSTKGELYVRGQDSSKIYAIDTSSNYLIGEVAGDSTQGSTVARVDGKVFFITQFANSPISVLDTSTNTVIANITGVQAPVWSGYISGSNELYIETYNQTVFAIDLSDYHVVAKIPIPYEYNSNFLYDPANGVLYTVTNGLPQNAGNGSPPTKDYLLMINTTSNTLLDTKITLPSLGFYPVLYNPANGEVYLYDGSSTLVAVSTMKDIIVASIPVRGTDIPLVIESPYIFYDSATGNVYATTDLNRENGTTGLLEISGRTNAVISNVTLAGLGFGNDLAFDSNNRVLFGIGYFSNVLMVNLSSGALVATTVLGTCSFVTPVP